MTVGTALDIVETWQNAVNQRELRRLIELSHPNIKIIGPRGVASGRAVLQDWATRSRITLSTLRKFARDGQVVLFQHANWQTPDDERSGHEIATSFQVREAQIVRIARFDSLELALEDAGLDTSHEVRTDGTHT